MPPPARRRRSPATPSAQLHIPLTCLPAAPSLTAGELAVAVGSKGGDCKGMVVKIKKTSRGFPVKRFFTLVVLWQKLVKSIKKVEKYKNSKPNFVVLCAPKTTTLSKGVFIFEL
jgi:hypothetical protein